MKKLFLKIANLIFEVKVNNENALSFFEFEYRSVILNEPVTEPNYCINISFSSKIKRGSIFKSTGRKFWFEFAEKQINLFIPYKYKENDFFKLINPFFESKSKMCLIDFFHNAFLSFLQVELLTYGITLFHASGLVDNCSKERDAILFFGKAQSGKSSLVSTGLAKDFRFDPISEDFCFVDCDSVYPLPHSTRVSLKTKKECHGWREKINLAINKFFKKDPMRRVSLDEYFLHKTVPTKSGIKRIFILCRECDDKEILKLDKAQFIDFCWAVLANEFRNFKGTKSVLSFKGWTFNDLRENTELLLGKIYENNDCAVLALPRYETTDKASHELFELLEGFIENE